jgi:hypothetical protein
MWIYAGKWVQVLRIDYTTDEEYYRAIVLLKGVLREPSKIQEMLK